jgi:hypothetical protein
VLVDYALPRRAVSIQQLLRQQSDHRIYSPGFVSEKWQRLSVSLTALGDTGRARGRGAPGCVPASWRRGFGRCGATLCNDCGPALNAYGLQADQGLYLYREFTATGGGDVAVNLTSTRDVVVNLTNTRVGGAFLFAPARLEHAADPRRRLRVDGLTYTGVPAPVSARAWRRLLRDGTPRYAALPYQQLAAGCRALGDERQAREVLMAQRDDELARTHPGWWERLWGQITKVTLGYGYKPWRALWFLIGVAVLSCLLAVVLGAHGALAQTSQTTTTGRPCTVIQRVSVGLDLNLPVGTSLARAGCSLARDSASKAAAWLATLGWMFRVLTWAFAALFIAGFTSAVRKT